MEFIQQLANSRIVHTIIALACYYLIWITIKSFDIKKAPLIAMLITIAIYTTGSALHIINLHVNIKF